MEFVVILLVLLPVIYGESQEMRVIRQLTNYFHFDHHFFLLDTDVDANQIISTDWLTPQTVYVWKRVEDAAELELTSKNCFMIVASQTTKFEHTINLLKVVKAMQIRKKQMKVGIFFARKFSSEDLLKLFEWCIDNQVTDTFAATYLTDESKRCTSQECLLNVFTFHPYKAASEPVNVTNSDSFDDYFQRTNPNFHQRALQYGGSIKDNVDGNVWLTVFELMNATFVEVDPSNRSIQETLRSGVDVLKYTYVPGNHNNLDVYPLRTKEYVILVPESLPYSDFLAYLKNGTSEDLLFYSILSTIGSIAVLSVLRYTKQKRILIIESAADVFNLTLNDNGCIKYQQLFRAEIFVIVPLTFVGFIVVNGVLSELTRHFTRPVAQPQMNTAEDIYRSKLPVLTHSPPWKRSIVELLSMRANYSDWDERVVVDENGVQKCIERFDRTKAVFVRSDMAAFLLRTQKGLNIKGYHQLPIEFSKFLFTYVVHRKFLFFERLNDIIQQFKSAGIYDLWTRRDYAARENLILRSNLVSLQHGGEASVKLIQFPMLIVYGWFTGFVVFILEILWRKLKAN